MLCAEVGNMKDFHIKGRVMMLQPGFEINTFTVLGRCPRTGRLGVAVTTTRLDPTSDMQVPLPWDPQGRARTGLSRESSAVCNWLVCFAADRADYVGGHVKTSILAEILRRIPRG